MNPYPPINTSPKWQLLVGTVCGYKFLQWLRYYTATRSTAAAMAIFLCCLLLFHSPSETKIIAAMPRRNPSTRKATWREGSWSTSFVAVTLSATVLQN